MKVLVVLATYNGEKYLRELLNSVFNQKGVSVDVFVADDCSTDGTIAILEEYSKKYPLRYKANKNNKGYSYNFLDPLFHKDNMDYDYFALADQDDYWLDNKLIKAIDKLNETGKNFYCSNLITTDENLEPTGFMEDESVLELTSKYTFVSENIATGCTIVFSKKFLEKLNKYYPTGVLRHDYYLFLLAAFTDDFVYDMHAYVKYRQHKANNIGVIKKHKFINYIKKFFKSDGHQSILCREILNGYSDIIAPEDKKILETMATYKKNRKARKALLHDPRYNKRKQNFFRKIKIHFNKY